MDFACYYEHMWTVTMKAIRRTKKGAIMAKVGIVMGSDSDMPVMAKAAEILDELGVD